MYLCYTFQYIKQLFVNRKFKIVYRVCLAILQFCEAELLECPFESIMEVLRDLPKRVDAIPVMEKAWSIPIKTRHIKALQAEYQKGLKSNSR